MGELLKVLIPTAVGLAVSPIPVIEMILVLFSQRRVANAIAFVLTLAAASAAAVAVGAAGQGAGDEDDTNYLMSAVVLGVAVFLLAIGIRYWRNRADKSEPEFFEKIYGMGPPTAAFLGLTAVVVNPKNLVLLLAAGRAIGSSDVDSKLLVGGIFLLLSMSTFLAATTYAIAGGESAKVNLERARVWLTERNRMIMGIVCIVLGIVLIAQVVANFV